MWRCFVKVWKQFWGIWPYDWRTLMWKRNYNEYDAEEVTK